MIVGNVTSDMGTVVGWANATIKDICFTPMEWTQFANAVNISNSQALNAGLLIGAAAALIGMFGAFKYMEYKKRKDWEKYGES